MKKFTLLLLFIVCSSAFSDWELTASGTSDDLLDILFVNSNVGYACGMNGTLVKTTNSGQNWITQVTGTSEFLTSLAVNPANTIEVFAAGNNGVILKTTNGGANWNIQNVGDLHNDIIFKDANTGIAAGLYGQMYRTVNGGTNWQVIDAGIGSVTMNSLFASSNNIYCSSSNGKILRSTNNGSNWTNYQTPSSFAFYSIYFVNDVTGYAVDNTGKVFKSSNSGVNWSQISVNSGTKYTITRNGIDMFMCGVQGKILKSSNNGVNWITQNTGTNIDFYAMQFVNQNVGFAAGEGGAIYRTSNGGEPIGINIISSEVPQKYELTQNYPNPFNPATKFKFKIPGNSHVSIIIYDASGKIAETLVDEEMRAGIYEADWDGTKFASGVYFYRIKTKDFSETRKMILLK